MAQSLATSDGERKASPTYDLYKDSNYFSDTLQTNFIYGTCCWIGTYVVLYGIIAYGVYMIGTTSSCSKECCSNNDYLIHLIASLLCGLPLTYVCTQLFDEMITKFVVMISSILLRPWDTQYSVGFEKFAYNNPLYTKVEKSSTINT